MLRQLILALLVLCLMFSPAVVAFYGLTGGILFAGTILVILAIVVVLLR
jgi:hypothetical protein